MAIFTGRTERAIAVAIEAHGDQTRKTDGTTPCIVHPVTVALILSRYTDDEDVIITGLLHDALGSTRLTEEDIARAFGEKVRDMVRDVTESDLPGLSWDTRKARYLRHLQSAPRGSLLVAGADKIARLVSLLAAHAGQGDPRSERLDADASVGQRLAFYGQVYQVVRSAWPTCPLLREFQRRLEEAGRKLRGQASHS
jgi:(p)ppGpp synthase/HD superfamily hydrolase